LHTHPRLRYVVPTDNKNSERHFVCEGRERERERERDRERERERERGEREREETNNFTIRDDAVSAIKIGGKAIEE